MNAPYFSILFASELENNVFGWKQHPTQPERLCFLKKEHVSLIQNICHSRAVCWMWNVTKPELTQIWVQMCWFREIKQRVMTQSNAKMIIPHQHSTFSDMQPLSLVIKSTKMEQIFHPRLCTSCLRGGRGFSFIPKTDSVGLERHVILKKSPRSSTGLFMCEGKLKQNSLLLASVSPGCWVATLINDEMKFVLGGGKNVWNGFQWLHSPSDCLWEATRRQSDNK